jgi:hypothetical protein
MRGPGPKWREKHADALISAASAQHVNIGGGKRARNASDSVPYSLWIVPAAVLALIGLAAVVALA